MITKDRTLKAHLTMRANTFCVFACKEKFDRSARWDDTYKDWTISVPAKLVSADIPASKIRGDASAVMLFIPRGRTHVSKVTKLEFADKPDQDEDNHDDVKDGTVDDLDIDNTAEQEVSDDTDPLEDREDNPTETSTDLGEPTGTVDPDEDKKFHCTNADCRARFNKPKGKAPNAKCPKCKTLDIIETATGKYVNASDDTPEFNDTDDTLD